jgi:citrate lyase subunit beta/citryl-CoA lyase
MPTLATARSFLFAPGSDERKLTGALDVGADAVIADLEDAVVPAEKARARALVAEVLAASTGPSLRLVRVNGAGSPWLEEDLAMIAALDLDAVVLPKATPDALRAVHSGLPVVAIVETAHGLHRAAEIANEASVQRLMLGAIDLALELALEARPDGLELLQARSTLVLASAVGGCRGPIDRVWADVRDESGLEADCRTGRSLGFRAKSCIHPAQVPVVNEVFSPSPDEIARARDVVDAYERAAAEGLGAVALEGEMIDLPVVERARQLLAEARRSVAHGE